MPARIDSLKDLHATAPSTRLGDSLRQLSDETSDLPIGAVVLLSDGADNSGGIGESAISALRARHIPVHTVGFGRERSEHDVELDDAEVAPRALADSRLAAKIAFHQRGYSGGKITLTVRDVSTATPKVLAQRTVTAIADGNQQTELVMFNVGSAGARTLQIAADPLPGEQNTANNALTRVVNVGADPRRILYIEGEPRWEYKFIRQAEEDDRMVQIVSIVRTSENKFYRQGISGAKELADGFPSRAEDLFGYQGLIIGSVNAGYFTPGQQELIREFVDRRGGGLLLLGGQFALADGNWNASTITDLFPTILPTSAGTFHREQDPRNGADPRHLRASPRRSRQHRHPPCRRPRRQRRQVEEAPLPHGLPGRRHAQARSLRPRQHDHSRRPPTTAPHHRELRSRSHRHHGHRRQLALADELALGDTAHDLFWQQLLRWLISDTPGHVVGSVPAQMLLDNGAVTLTAEVLDQQYNPAADATVEAHILGPSGVSALIEITPVPDAPGQFQAQWNAPKPGAYLTEVTARRGDKEIGRDVLTFQRMDGVAENFHIEQNRELLRFASTQPEAATGNPTTSKN